MKLALFIILSFLSFSSFGFVDSKNCPESFVITYSNIAKAPLSLEIENSWSAKAAWSTVTPEQKIEQVFTISSRTDSSLCVYINGKVAAFLQTNDGVDELTGPYNNNVNAYLRTKVKTFSRNHIELIKDEASNTIVAPVFVMSSDSVEVAGEVKIGTAESIEIKVLK